MLTMEPATPSRFMIRAADCRSNNGARTLTAMSRSNSSLVVSHTPPRRALGGRVDQAVDDTEAGVDLAHHPVAHVRLRRGRRRRTAPRSRGRQRGRRRVALGPVPADDGHAGRTARRRQPRRGLAQALHAAGHDDDLPGQVEAGSLSPIVSSMSLTSPPAARPCRRPSPPGRHDGRPVADLGHADLPERATFRPVVGRGRDRDHVGPVRRPARSIAASSSAIDVTFSAGTPSPRRGRRSRPPPPPAPWSRR